MDQKLHVPLSEKLKSVPGFFGIRLDQEPDYDLVRKESDFEVRRYPQMLLASTYENLSYDDSTKKMFTRLASYLFGDNLLNKEMAMTTPVFIEKKFDSWKMSFVLPQNLTSESIPQPNDQDIIISTEPAKTWAVLQYSGVPNEMIMTEKTNELRAWINFLNQYREISEARWAQYDGPMVIPFLRRNEVYIQVDKIQ